MRPDDTARPGPRPAEPVDARRCAASARRARSILIGLHGPRLRGDPARPARVRWRRRRGAVVRRRAPGPRPRVGDAGRRPPADRRPRPRPSHTERDAGPDAEVKPTSPTEDSTAAPSAPSAPTTYTVKRGDTLSGIAGEYGTTWQVLAELNDIKDPSALRVGTRSCSCPELRAGWRAARRGQRWQPRQYDVTNPPALTSVIRVPQRGHGWPPLCGPRGSRGPASRTSAARARAGPRSRVASVVARRRVERVDLLGRQAGALPERQQAGRVQDLVAVGVADPGHERLVAQQVLELARVALDPIAPDVEGQRRIVRVRARSRPRPRPGHRAIDAGRQQVDLAHLGRVAVADLGGRRRPAAATPRRASTRRTAAASRRWPGAPRTPRTTAVFVGQLDRRGAASWKRPVSIGLTTIASRSRSIMQELAAPADRHDPLTDQRRELGRRAADRERPRSVDDADRRDRARAASNASATTVRSGNSGTARRL